MTDPVDVHDINFTPIVLGQEEYSPLKKANNEEVKTEMLAGADLLVSKEIYSNTLTCGICTEFLMPEKVPHFCSTCQSVLFCRTCIYEWLGKKNEQNVSMNECPACREQSPKFVNALNDEKVKIMLEGIQLYCENKPFGCKEILTYFTFADHICGACPFCNQNGLLQSQLKAHYSSGCDGYRYECPFCHLNGTRDQIIRHRCYKMFDGMSANKFQITVNRIANKDNFKKNKQNIQCKVCKNLLRYYKVCGTCKADVCWKCTELINNRTQCCEIKFQNFQPPLKLIMSTVIENVRISCQGC
ncbi:hypothetical protein FGO68_gene3013 [Halteria grandinella]|uniref:RING-type domain-containing protein n=1 Tax=Halteria grandinella TaxID=5974 RepID=A0A8J8NUT0_HALGN|nr:hypothetical protein FGO68_gene3013 [Halteria grandinella]